MAIIECVGLTKTFDDVDAVCDVHLRIPDSGGIIGLLGPNGSGKTTLIKLLAGLLTPSEGVVRIAGKSVGVETKSIVAYLSDFHFLNDKYTITQQIEYYADFFPDFNREKAERMAKGLGMRLAQKIRGLSKGTKEKLALVLTLSRNAKVYLLDEPIAGVDPAAREYVLQAILANKNKDATLIISTHLISEIEKYFDYVVMLKEGRVAMNGYTEEIRAEQGKTIDELFREVFRWTI